MAVHTAIPSAVAGRNDKKPIVCGTANKNSTTAAVRDQSSLSFLLLRFGRKQRKHAIPPFGESHG
jgi:hypothetical protein